MVRDNDCQPNGPGFDPPVRLDILLLSTELLV